MGPPATLFPRAAEASWIQTLAKEVVKGDTVRILPAGTNSLATAKVVSTDVAVEEGVFSPTVLVRPVR
jgi:hypothetical protein